MLGMGSSAPLLLPDGNGDVLPEGNVLLRKSDRGDMRPLIVAINKVKSRVD
jgi:hypothetical protein